jgi:hypothetical protein
MSGYFRSLGGLADMKKAHKLLKRAIEDLTSVAEYLGEAGLERQAQLLDRALDRAEDVEATFLALE